MTNLQKDMFADTGQFSLRLIVPQRSDISSGVSKTSLRGSLSYESSTKSLWYGSGDSWINVQSAGYYAALPPVFPVGSLVYVGGVLYVSDGAAWTPAGVSGPGVSTDNAIARFDGFDGSTIQNSSATLSDTGDIDTIGYIKTTDATNSTSTATGSIITAGGVGVGGNIYMAGIADCPTAPTVGSHLTNKTYVDSVAGGGTKSILSLYSTSAGSLVSVATWPWHVAFRADADYSWTPGSGIITFNTTGSYSIDFGFSCRSNTNTNYQITGELYHNGASVVGSQVYISTNDQFDYRNARSGRLILNVTAGDTCSMRQNGPAQVTALANSGRIYIEKV